MQTPGSVVMAYQLSAYSIWGLVFWQWIELRISFLEGRFLTTGPPGKPYRSFKANQRHYPNFASYFMRKYTFVHEYCIQETVKDREAWLQSMGSQRVWHDWANEQLQLYHIMLSNSHNYVPERGFQMGSSIWPSPTTLTFSIPNKLLVLVVDLLKSCDDHPHNWWFPSHSSRF